MPGFDKTGPEGKGSMTGRKRGLCISDVAGSIGNIINRGFGLGRGGRARGGGFGWFRGRGGRSRGAGFSRFFGGRGR